MKITEKTPIKLEKSKLEAFSEKQFTVQMSGMELLALRLVSGKIGGMGVLRSIFSRCYRNDPSGFYDSINEIQGAKEAFKELKQLLDEKVTNSDNMITINDNLPRKKYSI